MPPLVHRTFRNCLVDLAVDRSDHDLVQAHRAAFLQIPRSNTGQTRLKQRRLGLCLLYADLGLSCQRFDRTRADGCHADSVVYITSEYSEYLIDPSGAYTNDYVNAIHSLGKRAFSHRETRIQRRCIAKVYICGLEAQAEARTLAATTYSIVFGPRVVLNTTDTSLNILTGASTASVTESAEAVTSHEGLR